jgi:hypothetical protein
MFLPSVLITQPIILALLRIQNTTSPDRKVVVEWLTLLHIREVPGSNLGPETGYPEVLRGLPQSLQATKSGTVP